MKKSNLLVCLLPVILFTTGARNAYAQLSAAFSSNRTQGCAPLVVQFRDESAGNPSGWRWDLGNGTISFLQNPAATYFNPGTYTIKLVVSKPGWSDSVIKTNYITVNASPVVQFAASDTNGCFPLNVKFTDMSEAGDGIITQWLWDFGDGDTSNVQHPEHVYSQLGNYNVSLRVRNSAGCVKTITRTNYIRVNNGAKAGFSFANPANCRPPTSVSFTNTSTGTGVLSYQWDFGDGSGSTQRDPVHTYINTGNYTVRLVLRNNTGCIDTITLPDAITIGTVAASFNSPAVVCADKPFTLLNNSVPQPVSAFWDFGDGSVSTEINPTKVYAAEGNYPIRLVTNFGTCSDSMIRFILVLAKPAASFQATDTNACKPPLSTAFSNTGTGATSYKWYFGDGDSSSLSNPNHTYGAYGSYTVTLIATNAQGCTDTVRRTNYINIQRPQVDIVQVPQEGCVPFTYRPVYTKASADSIIAFNWDFGDGNMSTLRNPENVYTRAGTYNIKLIYTTAGGCTDSAIAINAIKVGEKPNIQFEGSPRNACAFQPIDFKDLSTGPIADRWYWEFGDGGTSIERNPSHDYQDTGYFSVKLTVWSNGCKDSLIIPNYIYIKPPIAHFTDSSGCANKFSRWFIDQSIGANRWFWDFGDGNTSTEQNPVHTYSAVGSYIVNLHVSNDTCEHTTNRQVIIISEKTAFTASDTIVCKGRAVSFTSQNSSNNISHYDWTFTNRNTGTIIKGPSASTITINFIESGYYDASLVTEDLFGCRDTLVKPMYIRVDGPTADFGSSVPAICTKTSIVFSDSSRTDGLHAIRQWIWNYGDGDTDTLLSPPFMHSYQSAGNFTVQLTVVDEAGCTNSKQRDNFILISKPFPDFISPDSLSCIGKQVRFFNQTTGNHPITYQWQFGNAVNSVETLPTSSYSLEGDYTIRLVARDRYGCVDSIIKPAYIKIRNPLSAFTISDSVATCPPLVVNFSNLSQHYTNYEWDFGDGTKSTLNNPVHFYTYPGTYKAVLIVTSHGGCTHSSTRTIVVRGPQGTFAYDKNMGCEPTTVRFSSITSDTVSYVWDFDDGSVVETNDSVITHVYSRRGTFVPKMILVDPQGCRVPVTGKDTIRIFGVDAKFGISQQVICDSGLVHFKDSSIANEFINSYAWTFGDGSSSTARNPSHFYRETGQYPVQLIVKTTSGCTDTARLPVPIMISQTSQLAIQSDSGACIPALSNFVGLVISGESTSLQWQWNFGNGMAATVQNPPPVNYTSAGNYQVQLIGKNNLGCADTVHKSFSAWPLPPVDAGPNQVICLNSQANLQATGAVSYIWSPSTGLSCVNCPSPVATPTQNARYFVSGRNIHGCSAIDSVLIDVQQPFTLRVRGADTICVGEVVELFASGADQYRWSPANSLDNSQIDKPKARPTASTIYQVIGQDKNGCFRDTGQVPVAVYPYPSVKAGDDQTIASGGSVSLKATISADVVDIRWIPPAGLSCSNCANPVAAPKQTTNYAVEVRNEGGCIARDEVSIFVFCNNSNLFVPNTFSPNGDGNNDVFYPRGRGLFLIKALRIFNRWGELVFEQTNFQANDATKGWDGTHKGKPSSQDVYVYTLEVLCENQTVLKYNGNFALIR